MRTTTNGSSRLTAHAVGMLLVLVLACVPALGGKVLDGVPDYSPTGAASGEPGSPFPAGPDALDIATISPDAPRPSCGGDPLSGVPEYVWWYGCSPTSGGMMLGYWDAQPGFGNLYDGDASVWSGDGSTGTRSMVASTAHITAGAENGYTYGDWGNCLSYPNHEDNPDCIADFMHTTDGGSSSYGIMTGIEAYVEWDNPATAVNESYPATATNLDVPLYGGTFGYDDFKAEIDAGHPVLLNMLTLSKEQVAPGVWVPQPYGHTIVGYGYQDDMFQVKVPDPSLGPIDMTVGGIAVMDTWTNGTAGSEWIDWDWNVFSSVIDGNGIEWWPFVELRGSSWLYSADAPGPWDWMLSDAVTLEVVPEPATLSMLALGGIGLVLRRRRAA